MIIVFSNNITAYSAVKRVDGYSSIIFQTNIPKDGQLELVRKLAHKQAIERAGYYIRSFSRIENGELSNNDIKIIAYQKSKIISTEYWNEKDINGTSLLKAKVIIEIDDNEIEQMRKQEILEIKKKYLVLNNEVDDLLFNYNKISSKVLAYELYLEGNNYQSKNNIVSALECYERAIFLDSSQKEFYIAKGLMLYLLCSYEQAMDSFDKAIKIDPKSVKAYLGKAKVYAVKKDYRSAMIYYNVVLTLDDKNQEAIEGMRKLHNS